MHPSIRPWLAPALILLAASASLSGPGPAVEALTGGVHTRIVWVEGGLSLYGGGRIMGFDSRLDTAFEILPASTNQNKPILCSGGNRVVVSMDYRVHVVNWDGSGLRFVAEGIASDVWVEPSTGAEWVVVRTGLNTTENPVYRYLLDDPAQRVLLWDASPAGDYYMNWWQISADGRVAFDFLPWNRCFVIDSGGYAANGPHTGIGRGCWSSLASDNSYMSIHFPLSASGHTVFGIYRYLEHVTDLSLDSLPRIPGTIFEYYHPRFASNGGRFLTLTTGFADGREGDSVEVFFGKFNAGYTGFDGWVRITDNLVRDYTPDSWVGVEPHAPSINFSTGELRFAVNQGDTAPVADSVRVSTPYGQLAGLSASADSAWLTVRVSGSGSSQSVVATAAPRGLTPGRRAAEVTVICPDAVPQSRTFRVSVTVLGAPVATSITLSPAAARVETADTLRFAAVVLDQADSPLVVQPPLSWNVAGLAGIVDSSGLFSAVADSASAGICTLRVASAGVAAEALVAVVPPLAELVRLTRPVGGETFGVGGRVDVRWGVNDPLILYMHVKVSFDMGVIWDTVSGRISKWSGSFGSFGWVVPELLATTHGMVRTVCDSVLLGVFDDWDDNVCAVTPVPFRIIPAVTVSAPSADTTVWAGDTVTVQWTAADYVLGTVIDVSWDSGDNWRHVVSSSILRRSPQWGAYPWAVPDSLDTVALAGRRLLVKVANYADQSKFGVGTGAWLVRERPLRITSPAPGERLWTGDTLVVRWTADSARVSAVRVELSLDSGATWPLVLADSVARTAPEWGSASFAVTDSLSGTALRSERCMVRVRALGDPAVSMSRVFALSGPSLVVTGPQPGLVAWVGDTLSIAWHAGPAAVDTCRVYLSPDSGITWLAAGSAAVDSAGQGCLAWAVVDSLDGRVLVSENCRIRVCSGALCAANAGSFAIRRFRFTAQLTVPSDTVWPGDTLLISWSVDTSRVRAVRLTLVSPGGDTVVAPDSLVRASDTGWGAYAWVVTRASLSASADWTVYVADTTAGAQPVAAGSFTLGPLLSGEELPEEPQNNDCGCGSGTGLALLPPVLLKLRRRRRKNGGAK